MGAGIQGWTLTMRSALHALPVLQDNIIWIWERDGIAVVVDPAVAEPVQVWLEQRDLNAGGGVADPSPCRPHRRNSSAAGAVADGRCDRRQRLTGHGSPSRPSPLRTGMRCHCSGASCRCSMWRAHTANHIGLPAARRGGPGSRPRPVLRGHPVLSGLRTTDGRNAGGHAPGDAAAGWPAGPHQGLLRP